MDCPVGSLERRLEKASGFRHMYHELEFFGVCPGCHDGREREGAAAVDVPLLVATTVPAQSVQKLVTPGLPTIYEVQLGPVGKAQVYLDPGGPGQNELHVQPVDHSRLARTPRRGPARSPKS